MQVCANITFLQYSNKYFFIICFVTLTVTALLSDLIRQSHTAVNVHSWKLIL